MRSSKPLLRRAKTVNGNSRKNSKPKQADDAIIINTSHANSSSKALSHCFKYLGKGWQEVNNVDNYSMILIDRCNDN